MLQKAVEPSPYLNLGSRNSYSSVVDSYLFSFQSYGHLLGFYLEYSILKFMFKPFYMYILTTKNRYSFVLGSYLFYFESYEQLLGFYLEYSLWNILFSLFGLIFNQRLWYVNIKYKESKFICFRFISILFRKLWAFVRFHLEYSIFNFWTYV